MSRYDQNYHIQQFIKSKIKCEDIVILIRHSKPHLKPFSILIEAIKQNLDNKKLVEIFY